MNLVESLIVQVLHPYLQSSLIYCHVQSYTKTSKQRLRFWWYFRKQEENGQKGNLAPKCLLVSLSSLSSTKSQLDVNQVRPHSSARDLCITMFSDEKDSDFFL